MKEQKSDGLRVVVVNPAGKKQMSTSTKKKKRKNPGKKLSAAASKKRRRRNPGKASNPRRRHLRRVRRRNPSGVILPAVIAALVGGAVNEIGVYSLLSGLDPTGIRTPIGMAAAAAAGVWGGSKISPLWGAALGGSIGAMSAAYGVSAAKRLMASNASIKASNTAASDRDGVVSLAPPMPRPDGPPAQLRGLYDVVEDDVANRLVVVRPIAPPQLQGVSISSADEKTADFIRRFRSI
jgi:hypothetical protein